MAYIEYVCTFLTVKLYRYKYIYLVRTTYEQG